MSTDINGRSLVKAVLYVSGSTALAYLGSLLSNTLIARVLGPNDYGHYSYMVWLSSMLIVVMNHGLTSTAIRFISETLGRRRSAPAGAGPTHGTMAALALQRWFGRWHWASTALAALVFLLALPYAGPTSWSVAPWLLALLALGSAIPKATYIFGVSVAKGYGRFGVEASTMSILSVLNLLLVAVCWWLRSDLMTFLWLFVAINLAHPILLWVIDRDRHSDGAPAGLPDAALVARIRPQLGWTSLLILTTSFSGVAMCMMALNRHATAEAIAYFSVATALTRGGVELLSSGLNSVLMPVMARGYGAGGDDRAARIGGDAFRVFHFAGLFLAGVGAFWAGPIIIGMYGGKFADAIPTFRWLSLLSGLMLPLGVLGTLLATTDQQSLRFKLSIFTVSLSGVMAWTLIPAYGLPGALATLITVNLVVYTAYVVACGRGGLLLLPWGAAVRLCGSAVLAAALAGGLLLLSAGLWVQTLAGLLFIALYPLCTLWLRAWRVDDLALLAGQSWRLGRFAGLLRDVERWGMRPQAT